MVLIIDRKYISLCLSSEYSLITSLHIFVYELAERARISLPFHSIVHILMKCLKPLKRARNTKA